MQALDTTPAAARAGGARRIGRPAAPAGDVIEVAPGCRFGRLRVEDEAEPYFWRGRFSRRRWSCLCDCGAQVVVRDDSLKSGHTISCGCFRNDDIRDRSTRHGARASGARRAEYEIWQAVLHRRDGAVCRRWKEGRGAGFANFLDDLGERPTPRHMLVRRDAARPFSPSNCMWSDQQPRRGVPRRILTVRGKGMTLREASARFGLDYRTLCKRLERGWSPERALGI
jgi:hypothetical protein